MSEKVKLQEALAVVDQALSEYVEDLKYLQKNGDEDSRFDEDIISIRNAWEQVKTKVTFRYWEEWNAPIQNWKEKNLWLPLWGRS